MNKVVNKNDYEGYMSLYLAKTELNEKEKNTILKYSFAFISFCFVLSIPVVLITNFFYSILIITILSSLSVLPITNYVVKKEIKKVLANFPNISSNISIQELESILNNKYICEEHTLVNNKKMCDNNIYNFDKTCFDVMDKPKVKKLVKEKK